MTADEQLIQTRLDVAEMKGMLLQALSDHGQRITNLEDDSRSIHNRLDDKGKRLAAHEERITDLEDDNTARLGRTTGIIGTVVSIGALIVAFFGQFTF